METETYTSQRARILNLPMPFTKEELNQAFRKMAFKYHPDMGGDEKHFIAIKKAYDELLAITPENPSKDTSDNTRTYEGQLISNLGKGLGDLINSSDCPECHASGYKIITHINTTYDEVCPNCAGKGYVWTSKHYSFFSLFSFSGMERCTRCQGRGGFGRHENPHITYHFCYHCNGTGQIEIPNPALPKNRVFATIPNIDKRPNKRYCQCGALLRGNKCWRCDK
jgi:DnaJ domain